MADDNEFDQIVGQIRDALTIPPYGISDFYGSDNSFGIFDETTSDGELSLSPYAEEKVESLYHMDTVKDRYPEAVNLTNWRNLSFVHTYYNYFNNNGMKGNRLPLEIQGVSNQAVTSLPPYYLKYKPKSSWEELLTTNLLKTKGMTGQIADNYFLFFPDAEPEIAPQGISFTSNFFGIICLRWDNDKWIYQAWWFKTPSKESLHRPNPKTDEYKSSTQTFFCENSFPLRNFRRSTEDYDYASDFWDEQYAPDFEVWGNGHVWSVNGGGFYLGQDAKPFLDLFPKTQLETTELGVFNWWW